MSEYIFKLKFKVRDYELDAEGIVNNANYLHYLEHTRHEFCDANGLSFTAMREQGIIPVLNKVEIEYKTPLRGNDEFESCLYLERKGVRFIFHQDIFKLSGEQVVKATVSCVCLVGDKLDRGDALAEVFKDFLK